jgi:hypothetical protein
LVKNCGTPPNEGGTIAEGVADMLDLLLVIVLQTFFTWEAFFPLPRVVDTQPATL